VATFPTIITNSYPVSIATASPSFSYSQLLGSLVSTSYKVKKIYLNGSDIAQISTPFTLSKLNADGTVYSNPSNANVDPYQFTPSLYIDTNDNFIIDILTPLQFTLHPNSYLEIMFFTDSSDPSYLLNSDDTEDKENDNKDSEQKVKQSGGKHFAIAATAAGVLGLVYVLIKPR
jgi:hypothetical protein